MKLPEQVHIALDLLESGGFEAFLVGGCVRDHLMGREQKDYDITTDATPEQIVNIFDNYKVIETGIKHGTVTVLINSIPLEITTFRIDGDYSDNRRPDEVSFTKKLNDDLSRRDFTMNAVCYNPKTRFIDLFGGIQDIKNKVIRAVGDSEKRFNEDALRILRAIRFASQFGFNIEKNTANAIFKTKLLLKNISAERIASELNKTLAGENMQAVFTEYYEIFGVVIPELPAMLNDITIHSIETAHKVKNKPHLKLAALFQGVGKPAAFSQDRNGKEYCAYAAQSMLIADKILSRLKYDNSTKNRILTLMENYDTPVNNDVISIKRQLNKLTPDIFFDLIDLKKADCLAKGSEFHFEIHELNDIIKTAKKIINERQCFSLKDLCINGNNLQKIGIPEGREIGETLNAVLDLVIEGKLNNNKEEIFNRISQLRGVH